MSRETLKREPIVVGPVDVSREFKETVVTPLFEECGKLLHYLTPEERARQIRESERRLQLALMELEIEPFSASSVRKYKRIKSFAFNLPKRAVLTVLFGIAALALRAAIGDLLNQEDGLKWLGLFMLFIIIGGVIVAVLEPWKWQRSDLSDYSETVPEFVLARALEVRKKCNTVQIEVRYLAKDLLESRAPTVDPFLVASVGSVEYYLEVWDEPGFKPQSP